MTECMDEDLDQMQVMKTIREVKMLLGTDKKGADVEVWAAGASRNLYNTRSN